MRDLARARALRQRPRGAVWIRAGNAGSRGPVL